MLKRQRALGSHGWMILESRHRDTYAFGMTPPRLTPQAWFDSGYMRKASTLDDLAAQCGLDPTIFAASIARYNAMVAKGVDADFHRGESTFNRFYGDNPIRLFDGNQSHFDYRQVPLEERLSYINAFGTTTSTFYADALGSIPISAPTNAGTYYVRAFFTADGQNHGGKTYSNAAIGASINTIDSADVTSVDFNFSGSSRYAGR